MTSEAPPCLCVYMYVCMYMETPVCVHTCIACGGGYARVGIHMHMFMHVCGGQKMTLDVTPQHPPPFD